MLILIEHPPKIRIGNAICVVSFPIEPLNDLDGIPESIRFVAARGLFFRAPPLDDGEYVLF